MSKTYITKSASCSLEKKAGPIGTGLKWLTSPIWGPIKGINKGLEWGKDQIDEKITHGPIGNIFDEARIGWELGKMESTPKWKQKMNLMMQKNIGYNENGEPIPNPHYNPNIAEYMSNSGRGNSWGNHSRRNNIKNQLQESSLAKNKVAPVPGIYDVISSMIEKIETNYNLDFFELNQEQQQAMFDQAAKAAMENPEIQQQLKNKQNATQQAPQNPNLQTP